MLRHAMPSHTCTATLLFATLSMKAKCLPSGANTVRFSWGFDSRCLATSALRDCRPPQTRACLIPSVHNGRLLIMICFLRRIGVCPKHAPEEPGQEQEIIRPFHPGWAVHLSFVGRLALWNYTRFGENRGEGLGMRLLKRHPGRLAHTCMLVIQHSDQRFKQRLLTAIPQGQRCYFTHLPGRIMQRSYDRL